MGAGDAWEFISKGAWMREASDCGNILGEAVGEINNLTQTLQNQVQRGLLYVAWVVGSLLFFWRPLHTLIVYEAGNDNASYVLLIPFLCAWLIFLRREHIFCDVSFDPSAALIPFVLAIGVITLSLRFADLAGPTGYASALALFWISGFILIFGRNCLKKARFAMLFLLLMIPLPETILNHVVYFLQKGSAEIAAGLFDLTGVPVLREGFVFRLPRVTIEVAQECSGIRSSMALLVLALLVSHLYLRKFWKQAFFIVCGMIVMIVKNGIRIVTLTLLASYVDPGFLYGDLHHKGGIVFFLVGLLILLPILWLLRKGEFAEKMGADPVASQHEG